MNYSESTNQKGSIIADLFKHKYGQDVLKPNWFKACAKIMNENKVQESAQHL